MHNLLQEPMNKGIKCCFQRDNTASCLYFSLQILNRKVQLGQVQGKGLKNPFGT